MLLDPTLYKMRKLNRQVTKSKYVFFPHLCSFVCHLDCFYVSCSVWVLAAGKMERCAPSFQLQQYTVYLRNSTINWIGLAKFWINNNNDISSPNLQSSNQFLSTVCVCGCVVSFWSNSEQWLSEHTGCDIISVWLSNQRQVVVMSLPSHWFNTQILCTYIFSFCVHF